MVADPRCPECDGPVGTTSSYCMHCGAEFDHPVGVGDTDTGSDRDASPDGETAGLSSATLTGWEDRLARWLGPDGWLDDSLTVVVAIVFGLFIGPLAGGFLGLVTGSAWAIAVGIVIWLGSTAYLARRRTVLDAVSQGSLAVAGLVAVFPLSFLVAANGGFTDRIVSVVVFEFAVGLFVALPLFVVGKVTGRLRTTLYE